MGKAIVLYRSDVAASWSCMLENAQGNAARIYRSTAAAILAAHIPDVYLERTLVKPSSWSKLEREYLVVTNERFRAYQIFIGSYDYGTNLAIYWQLVVVPPDLFTSLSARDLNLFQQEELHAYVTVIHRCLRQAIAELLLALGQEPSLLEANSTGFLGVE
jgi:hypothetical protein